MTQENDTTTERKLWFSGAWGRSLPTSFAEVINDALLATIIPNGVQTLQPLKISALKELVLASMGILWYT